MDLSYQTRRIEYLGKGKKQESIYGKYANHIYRWSEYDCQ